MTVLAVSCVSVVGVIVLRSAHVFAQRDAASQGISGAALAQMVAIATITQSLTPAQLKIDSNLVFSATAARGELAGTWNDRDGVAGCSIRLDALIRILAATSHRVMFVPARPFVPPAVL